MTVFDFDITRGIFNFAFDELDTESHSHPAVEIILSQKGTFTIESNGIRYENLKFAIIDSNTIHKVRSQNCTVKILMIESNNSLFTEFLEENDISMKEGIFLREKYSHMEELYATIKMCAETNDLKTPPDDRVQRSMWLLENENLDYKNFISTLTSAVYLSESRLTHLFKKHIGVSLKKYLVWVRLKQAMALYLEGDLNLTEVSAESGFFDQAHLANSFKAVLGVSPSKAYNSRIIQL